MRFRSILGSATAGAVLTATALVAAGAAPAQAAPARGLGTTSLASVLGADGVKFDSQLEGLRHRRGRCLRRGGSQAGQPRARPRRRHQAR